MLKYILIARDAVRSPRASLSVDQLMMACATLVVAAITAAGFKLSAT